jgi:osmotically-inducible protein OsmY
MVRREAAHSGSDWAVEDRIRKFLNQYFPRLQAVKAEVRQGVVTMGGRVNSFYERQLCIHCCQQVSGWVQLNDQVQVAVVGRQEFSQRPMRQPKIALAG